MLLNDETQHVIEIGIFLAGSKACNRGFEYLGKVGKGEWMGGGGSDLFEIHDIAGNM